MLVTVLLLQKKKKKSYDQGNLYKKGFILAYGLRRLRITAEGHSDKLQAWQQEQSQEHKSLNARRNQRER